jgi:hypothetical protein
MQYKDRYPIIVTAEKAACRDFWARHLGFQVMFEATGLPFWRRTAARRSPS